MDQSNTNDQHSDIMSVMSSSVYGGSKASFVLQDIGNTKANTRNLSRRGSTVTTPNYTAQAKFFDHEGNLIVKDEVDVRSFHGSVA